MEAQALNDAIANLKRAWANTSTERDILVEKAWTGIFTAYPQPEQLDQQNAMPTAPFRGNLGALVSLKSIPVLENYDEWNEAFQKCGRSAQISGCGDGPPVLTSANHVKTEQLPFSQNNQGGINRGLPNGGSLNVAALKSPTLVGPKAPPGSFQYEDDIQYVGQVQTTGFAAAVNPTLLKRGKFDNNEDGNSGKLSGPNVPSFVSAKSRYQSQSAQQDRNVDQGPPLGTGSTRPFKPPTRLNEPPGRHPNAPPAGPARSVGSRPQHTFAKAPVTNTANVVKRSHQVTDTTMEDADVHPRLRGIDPDLIERIENEILESGQPVTFDDIAGLSFAKQCIEEMVVWPVKNPEFYTGLRQLPKGLLLFGPPGTGKTVLGKAIAHECNATFFSISASSLTSKWIGEGEKMVRALFAVASARQPSVVFIDEIDSLLTQRSADENEASRRIKTEFLVQFDGAATGQDDVVLIIGATNRPQELDEAARRRFVRRLYVPLPDAQTRCQLLTHLLKKNDNCITVSEVEELGRLTEGYSGADVTNLAREASMGPLREVLRGAGSSASNQRNRTLRPISRKDFDVALRSVKASVSNMDLAMYEKWNNEFGTQQFVE